MTRWARGGDANKKKPHDASSWEELKQEMGKQQSQRSNKVKKKRVGNEKVKQRESGRERAVGEIAASRENKVTTVNSKPGERNKAFSRKAKSSDEKRTQYQPSCSRKSLVDVLLETDETNELKRGGGMKRKCSENEELLMGNQEYLNMLCKKENRSEERRLKRQKKKKESMVCFHCRQPGHGVADCPQMLGDVEQGTGICFRCGSTEHDISKCTAKVDKKLGEFPYAKCFICQQTGHLSRTCPDNPRGLYPEGGCCKECGSVEHRWWNCPVRKPVKGVSAEVSSLMGKRNEHMSADAEPAFMLRPKVKVKKTGPKVVVF